MKRIFKSFPICIILMLMICNYVFAETGSLNNNLGYTVENDTLTFFNEHPGSTASLQLNNTFKNLGKRTDFTKVQFQDEVTVIYSSQGGGLFSGWSNVTEINLTNLVFANNVTSISGLFKGCTNLTTLVFGDTWNTQNITNMSNAFEDCENLSSLDLSGWNASNAVQMNDMFSGCSSLTNLVINDGWVTSTAGDISYMFHGCSSLTSLDLSSWDTSGINMDDGWAFWEMFSGCTSLETLNLSGWDVSGAEDMTYMFSDCESLTTLDISGWEVSQDVDIDGMFSGCSALEALDFSGWDTSNVSNYDFSDCSALKTLTLGPNTLGSDDFFDNLPDYDEMWYYIEKAQGIESSLNIGDYKFGDDLFGNYDYQQMGGTWTTDYSGGDTETIFALDITIAAPVANTEVHTTAATSTENVTLSDFAWSPASFINGKFSYSTAYTASVTATAASGYAFDENIRVRVNDEAASVTRNSNKSLTVSFTFPETISNTGTCGTNVAWSITDDTITYVKGTDSADPKWAADCVDVFRTEQPIKTAVIGESMGVKDTDELRNMFYECEYIEEMDLSKLVIPTSGEPFSMYSMFENCYKLETLNLSGWNTSNVSSMSRMFDFCNALSTLQFGDNWDTSGVTEMLDMFHECKALTNLDLSGWNVENVEYMNSMFSECTAMETLNLSGWDVENVKQMVWLVADCESLTTLDLSGWKVGTLYMSDMFSGCTKLEALDLSSWDTSNVTSYDFSDCAALKTLTLGPDTLKKSDFINTLPNYAGPWKYIEKAQGIESSLAVGSYFTGTGLFGSYDYQQMGGTWTVETRPESTITLSGVDENKLGDSSYTYNSEAKTYSLVYNISDLPITLPETPLKEGSTFIGWTGDNGTTPEISVTLPVGSAGIKVYTANWVENPVIAAGPQDLSLTYGYTSGNTLSVAASAPGGCTLSYQWYSNTTDSTEGSTLIPGASGSEYIIETGKSAGFEEYYYCVVTTVMNGTPTAAQTVSGIAAVTVAKKQITLAGTLAANSKTYDGTTDATFDTSGVVFTGKLDSDTLDLTITGTFDSPEIGTRTVTVDPDSYQLTGEKAANYELTNKPWTSFTSVEIFPIRITAVDVTDIDAPVTGIVLDTQADTSTANVTLSAVSWDPAGDSAGKAVQYTVYTASVTAQAAEHYVFADTLTVTVNGETADVTRNSDGTLTISYTFPQTGLETGLCGYPSEGVPSLTYLINEAGDTINISNNSVNTEAILDDTCAAVIKDHPVIKKVYFDDPIEIWGTSYFGNNTDYANVEEMYLQNVSLNNDAGTSLQSFFSGFSSLKKLDLSGWNTSGVTNMNSSFYNCGSLEELILSGWNTSSVTNSGSAFDGCSKLMTLTLGPDTLNQNIFSTLPTEIYNGLWKKISQPGDLPDPETNPVGTILRDHQLFTSYVSASMPGTWTRDFTQTITLSGVDEGKLGDTAYVYDSTEETYNRTYTDADLPITLPTPEKTGHTFAGWTGENGTTPETSVVIPAESTGDKDYTANWAANPSITGEPQDLSLTYGYTTGNTLSVTAAAPDGCTLSYQWYSNTSDSSEGGSEISGAVYDSYTIDPGKSAGFSEYYYCVVTAVKNGNPTVGTAVSRAAAVTVGKKQITLGGTLTANNKTYDTTTDASFDTSGVIFTGKLDEDALDLSLAGTFESAGVGTWTVTVDTESYQLTGEKAANYELTNKPWTSFSSVEIFPVGIDAVAVTDIKPPAAGSVLDMQANTSTANVSLSPVSWSPAGDEAGNALRDVIYTGSVTAQAGENYVFTDTVTATVNGNTAAVTRINDRTLTISYTFPETSVETGSCGTNISYMIAGDTIRFFRTDESRTAEWSKSFCNPKFQNDPNIKIVWFDSEIVIKTSSTFADCKYVEEMYLPNVVLSDNAVSGSNQLNSNFRNCKNLKVLDLSGWQNTSAVTKSYAMFSGCGNLEELNMSGWNTSGLSESGSGDFRDMFSALSSLKTLTLGPDTQNSNIFSTLPSDVYNAPWKRIYLSDGTPDPAETILRDHKLFTVCGSNPEPGTCFDPASSPGTWTREYTQTITLSGVDEGHLGSTAYVYDSSTETYSFVYTDADLPVTLPETPTKDGYSFTGWTGNNGSTPEISVVIPVKSTGDKAYTANWEENPVITGQPQDLPLTYGYTTGNTLSVTASAPGGCTLSYQWYSNTSDSTEGGTEISGAESDSYTIDPGKPAGFSEYYYCIVTSVKNGNPTAGTAVTRAAAVTVGKKQITLEGTLTANDKPYDGTTDASFDTSGVRFTGKLDEDELGLSLAGSFESPEIGTWTVTIDPDSYQLTGEKADNYELSNKPWTSFSSVQITQGEIPVVAVTITPPAANEILDTTPDTTTSNITLSSVSWNPEGGTDGKASYNTVYTASFTVTPAEKYSFPDGVTVTVNGETADTQYITRNADGTLTISYPFPKTSLESGTCGTNVKWEKDGDTIRYTRLDPNDDFTHWHSRDCGKALLTSEIKKVYIDDEMKVSTYLMDAFAGNTNLEEMYLSKFVMNLNDLDSAFSGCSSLRKLDISGLGNTSVLTSLYMTFANCSSLTELDLSGWDTSNVEDMESMFVGCSSLSNLKLHEKWVTPALTKRIDSMFAGCSSLTDSSLAALYLNTWDTSNVKYMENVFKGCSRLTDLSDISNWKTASVLRFSSMFEGCSGLQTLNLNSWNTASAQTLAYMFSGCSGLQTLDLSRWHTDNVTNTTFMFNGCTSLSSLDVSSWNTSKITTIVQMFENCSSLTELDLSGWNTPVMSEYGKAFSGSGIRTLTLGKNTFAKSIYDYISSPHYLTGKWVYIAQGADASDPLPLGTIRTGIDFLNQNGYNYTKMAGTWTVDFYTITLKNVDQDKLGDDTYTYDSSARTYSKGYIEKTLPITLPESPVKSSWVFAGWTGTDVSEATKTVTIPTGSTEDREYTAQWVKITVISGPEDLELTYGYTDGNTLTVTAEETAGHTLSYQWYRAVSADTTEGGTPITGETGPSYTIPTGKETGTTEYYYCVVTSARSGISQTAETVSRIATVTVINADMDVSAVGVDTVYDGNSYSILVTVTEPDTGYTIKYGSEEGSYSSDTNPSFTDVCEVTVYYQVTAENYNTFTGSAVVKITPAAITISADDKEKDYDNDPSTDPLLTAVVKYKPEKGVDPVYTLSREPGQNIGVYVIKVTAEAAANPNYTITTENGVFEIKNILIDISGSKTWDDGNNRDGKRPESVTINLLANGRNTKEQTVTPDTGGNWNFEFTDLPKYDNASAAILYTVEEVPVSDYTTVVTGDAQSGFTVTNTHVPETTEATVKKFWDDADDQDGKRNGVSAEMQLWKTVGSGIAEPVGTPVKVDATDSWSNVWSDLPVYENGTAISYSVSEILTTANGYTTDGSEPKDIPNGGTVTITNTHATETTSITVSKVWNDGNDQDGRRKNVSAEIQLWKTVEGGSAEKVGKPVLVGTTDGWTKLWSGLPVYEGGKAISYSVKETLTEANGYTSDGTSGITIQNDGTGIITNSWEPETTSITVKKVWDDQNDRDGKRSGVTASLQLYKTVGEITTAVGKAIPIGTDENISQIWMNLPVYESGKEISYSVKETLTEANGYTSDGISGITIPNGGTDTITNTYTPETVEAAVKKIWDDADDQDGKRPASLTVTLSNGDEVTLSESNNWTASVSGLPKYENHGTEITYTWTEGTPPAGYQKTGESVTGNLTTLTNSHTPETTEATVTKIWDDADNRDGKRPDSLSMKLSTGDIVLLTAINRWTGTVTGLPKYEAGTEIQYTWTEGTMPEGYTMTDTVVSGTVTTITNSYEPQVMNVSVKKVWDDDDDRDGIRPASLDVTLSNGTVVTLNEVNGWTATVSDLPIYEDGRKIEYSWNENEVPEGYELTGKSVSGTLTTLTDSHAPETTEAAVRIVWNDADDRDGKRPESLTMILSNGMEIVLTAAGNWTGTVTGLPKYDAGIEIEYTWTAGTLPKGYEVTETAVSGTLTSLTIGYTPETVEVSVKKVWDDDNNRDGIRPDSLTVTLSNGDTVTLSESNNWTASVSGLPKYENHGMEIEYTWTEGTLPEGYEKTGEFVTGSLTTLTNSHTPEITEATVTKIWDDADDRDGKRPDSLIMTLSNGMEIVLTAENNWTGTVTDLPKYDAGMEIEYTWTEGTLPEGYELTETTVNGTVTTMTNSYEPEVTSASVKKVWKDDDDRDGIRPAMLGVTLSDGTVVTLSEANGWTTTVRNLPVYEDGRKIEYSWSENEIPEGYSLTGISVTGTLTTLTDTHEAEQTEVTAVKVWDDDNDRDGIRPASVTINLLADGTNIRSMTAGAESGWKAVFSGLPKYRDRGHEIVYTVSENAVEGYETEINGFTVTNTHTPGPGEMIVTADDVDVTYDGQPHGITVRVSGPSDYTIRYGTVEGVYDLTDCPTITDADDKPFIIYYQVTAEGYEPVSGSASVTIARARVTVTADDKIKVVNTPDPVLTWTAEGLVNGDDPSVLSVTISRETGEDVGEYVITPKGLVVQGNYIVIYVTGKLTITDLQPKPLSDDTIRLVLIPVEYEYDGTEKTVDYYVYDSEFDYQLVEGEDYVLVESQSVLTATDPGTYIVTVTADNVSGNTNSAAKSPAGIRYYGTRSAAWRIVRSGGSHSLFPIFCEDCLLPNTGFSSAGSVEPVKGKRVPVWDTTGISIQIPRFNLETDLVMLPMSGNTWPVDQLEDKAGLLEGSDLPGMGYSLIAGHNTLTNSEYGPFDRLYEMVNNDAVFVRTDRNELLRYRVYANELITPDDFVTLQTVAEQEPGSLVLITCENESEDGQYLNRRVVFAKPVR